MRARFPVSLRETPCTAWPSEIRETQNRMAIYRCELSSGSRQTGQSAKSKIDYICRQEKYATHADRCLYFASRLPEGFSETMQFWKSADKHERANARLYQEFKLSLPIELKGNIKAQIDIVENFIEKSLPGQPYTFAIHAGKETNPHAHLVFSERVIDSVAREPDIFFKRANKKNPERGGAAKNRSLKSTEFLCDAREQWANAVNEGLYKNASLMQKTLNHVPQVDHRSRKERGLEPATPAHLNKAIEDKFKYMEINHAEGDKTRSRKDAERSIERAKERIKDHAGNVRKRSKEAFKDAYRSKREAGRNHKDIKQGAGRARNIRQEGLGVLKHSLEARERKQGEHKSFCEEIRDSVESVCDGFDRTVAESAQRLFRRTERADIGHQPELGKPEILTRQIETRSRAVEREYPRVGNCNQSAIGRVRETVERIREGITRGTERIKKGIKQFVTKVNSFAEISLSTGIRHTTTLLNMAKSIEELPESAKRLKKGPVMKITADEISLVNEELEVKSPLPELKSPGYECPWLKEQRELESWWYDKKKSIQPKQEENQIERSIGGGWSM